jgi:hypothetical protein
MICKPTIIISNIHICKNWRTNFPQFILEVLLIIISYPQCNIRPPKILYGVFLKFIKCCFMKNMKINIGKKTLQIGYKSYLKLMLYGMPSASPLAMLL